MTRVNTEKWSRAEAEEFFALLTGRVPARSREFVASVGAVGGPGDEMERRDIDCLVPAWTWYVGWLDAGASPPLPRSDPAPSPPWHDAARGSPLAAEMLWAVDGMACFYSEVALRVLPGARWVLWDNHRMDLDYYFPVIVTPRMNYIEPIGLAYGFTLRALEGAAHVRVPDGLSSLLAKDRAHATSDAPLPPAPTVSDLLDLYTEAGHLWLGIDDELRVMIGEEALDALESTLLEVPGIRGVDRSDTELFILDADVAPEALRPRLVELMERLRDANPEWR